MLLTQAEYQALSGTKSALSGETNLDAALERASAEVDGMTYGRITAAGMDRLTTFQQNKIKQAVADQADFDVAYGDLLDNPLQSYAIGGVSMSFDRKVIRQVCGVWTSRAIYSLIESTGLTYAGVIG